MTAQKKRNDSYVIEVVPLPDTEYVSGKKSPLRQCIVTGTVAPKESMLRFVVDPSNNIVPDVDGRLPGRGFWVMAQKGVIQQAAEGKFFSKAARAQVNVPVDLAVLTARILEQRCLGLLSLARRGGLILSGFDSVTDALRHKKETVALLITANDASMNAMDKVRPLATDLPVITAFSGDALGQIFGRDKVIHGALLRSPLADAFLKEFQRLAGITSNSPTLFSPPPS